MYRSLHMTWLLLMLTVALMSLTVLYLKNQPGFAAIIMGLSAIKFLLVAFYFMDMKKANSAWKSLLILFTVTLSAAVVFML